MTSDAEMPEELNIVCVEHVTGNAYMVNNANHATKYIRADKVERALTLLDHMEKHKGELKGLVEAGQKANQDSWHAVGLPWNNQSLYINTESEDPHIGRAIIDCIDVDTVSGDTDEEIDAEWQRLEAENDANMVFVEKAANTRPLLSQTLKILEG